MIGDIIVCINHIWRKRNRRISEEEDENKKTNKQKVTLFWHFKRWRYARVWMYALHMYMLTHPKWSFVSSRFVYCRKVDQLPLDSYLRSWFGKRHMFRAHKYARFCSTLYFIYLMYILCVVIINAIHSMGKTAMEHKWISSGEWATDRDRARRKIQWERQKPSSFCCYSFVQSMYYKKETYIFVNYILSSFICRLSDSACVCNLIATSEFWAPRMETFFIIKDG